MDGLNMDYQLNVPAILRAVAATREGRPAVLEMITKEEPVYPVSRSLVDDAVRQLQPV